MLQYSPRGQGTMITLGHSYNLKKQRTPGWENSRHRGQIFPAGSDESHISS